MELVETQAMHRIPKRLSFVWGLLGGSGDLPQSYRANFALWKGFNRSWNVQLLHREAIVDIANDYKQYPFDRYPKNIQRCDACRPMLLHKFGGVYSDLDVEPHGALDRLFAAYPHADVILAVETILPDGVCRHIGLCEPIRNGRPELPVRIANYFMASVSGHPFWLDVMELMRRRSHLPIERDYDVLYTTGPDVVTEAAYGAKHRYSNVIVVPPHEIGQFLTHRRAGAWRGEEQMPGASDRR